MLNFFLIFLFFIAVLVVFITTVNDRERERESRRMAIEELAALEKHSIRYHLTLAEKERILSLKAYIDETAPASSYRGSGSNLGGAMFTAGVVGYTLYRSHKDAERAAQDIRKSYKA